jgi:hypothetical protein
VLEEKRKFDANENVVGSPATTPTTTTEARTKSAAHNTSESDTSICENKAKKNLKEIKRLYENIVKDQDPLPSKRKRTIIKYKDSMNRQDTAMKKRRTESPQRVNENRAASKSKDSENEDETSLNSSSEVIKSKKTNSCSKKDYPELMKKMMKHQKKKIKNDVKKKYRSTMITQGKLKISMLKDSNDSNGNESEWEDIDETKSNDENKKVQPQIECSTVANMCYTLSRKGFIFKCLVAACKHQTMNEHSFLSHLTETHTTIKWTGHCQLCNDRVLKESYSLNSEFLHMMMNHISKEKITDNLPDITEIPEPPKIAEPTENIEKLDIGGEAVQADNFEILETPETPEIVVEKEPSPQNIAETAKEIVEVKTIEEVKKTSSDLVGKKIPLTNLFVKPLKLNTVVKETMPKITVKSLESLTQPVDVESKIALNRIFNLPAGTRIPTNLTKLPSFGVTTGSVIPKNVEHSKSSSSSTSTLVSIKDVSSLIANAKGVNVMQKCPAKSDNNLKLQPSPFRQSAIKYFDLLRPWATRKCKKFMFPLSKLLEENALIAKYKCLSQRCYYYTCSAKNFEIHLSAHKPADRIDFMMCPYCDFELEPSTEIRNLIKHIDEEHSASKYQCAFCFYRSTSVSNVISHSKIYHRMKNLKIYELHPVNDCSDVHLDIMLVKEKYDQFIPLLKCVLCAKEFYIIGDFMLHMLAHDKNEKFNSKCNKCREKADFNNIPKHLLQCHNIGTYQCVYCTFGTNTLQVVSDHLADKHASKLALFCERRPPGKNPHQNRDENTKHILKNTTVLKFVTQEVNPNIVEKRSINAECLLNAESIFNMGEHEKSVVIDSKKPPATIPTTVELEKEKAKSIGDKEGVENNLSTKENINDERQKQPTSISLQIGKVFSLSTPDVENSDKLNEIIELE